ncbi:MAG: replicative DNA helicase [Deferribacteraceae bacterium]|jgi:replicative DNA helicase|nr:replicative DNA helicase [Deferribacteraceae bacterium]
MAQNEHVRIPPHNEEAEQAVLASLMIEADAYDKIVGIITANDFYNKSNGIIFSAITSMYNSLKPYDLTSILGHLRSEGTLERIGGLEYVMNLTFIIPNAANLAKYANQVKEKAKLRELIDISTNINDVAYEYDRDTSLDVDEAVDKSGQMIMDLAREGSHRDPKLLPTLIAPMYQELERLGREGADVTGLPTGFIDLDAKINGLQRGSLIIIAGRPGMGKTSFALNMAQNVARDMKKTVAVFSLEMTTAQLVQRIISAEAEVSQYNIQTGKLSQDDWARLAATGNVLDGMNIFLDDTSNISAMEIRAKCRRLKVNKAHGLDLVIIDYLQLMENNRIEQREQQIADISRNLKGLAKDLDIPVIALAQLNRSVETRQDKHPMLSDLRESGAIEQDADQILFIYREEYYNQDTAKRGIAEVVVAKNRSGSTGSVALGFVGTLTKFRNLDKGQF